MTSDDGEPDIPDPGTPDPGTTARLRRALHARADQIEPASDGLDRIEEQLMPRTNLTDAQRWILGGVAAVAVILVGVILVLSNGGDDDLATDTSSTTTEATSTTTSSSTTTTTFDRPVDPYDVAFPSPTGSRRFGAPAPAARAYAVDVLGFRALVIGEVDRTDDGTAEVTVSDREDGPETVIELERLGEDSWFATRSHTEDIEVDEPAAGVSLATPFQTHGSALAFEGTVDVLVLEQGDPLPLGTGFVTGSGTPPPGPFSGRITYSPPAAPVPGVLVYRTLSPEDGRVQRATSFPVRLTPEELATPPEECGDTGDDNQAEPDDRVVKVYFHCARDDEAVALRRTVPADDPAVLTNTLRTLLEGPTDAEREAGFTSVFPVEGGEVQRVVIDEGVAIVDLSPALRENLANSSANISTLTSELFRTSTQFSSVAAVEVRLDGSCEAFAEWSQLGSCVLTEP